MPAHELRKQVLTRIWQEEALRLDALCIALSKTDRPLGRSVVVNKLVEDAYNALPEDVRAKATAAARQLISHHRPPDADEPAAE